MIFILGDTIPTSKALEKKEKTDRLLITVNPDNFIFYTFHLSEIQ